MNCNGEMANWKVFRGIYVWRQIAAELSANDLVVQVETLKTIIGKECKQILNRLGHTAAEFNKILTKL